MSSTSSESNTVTLTSPCPCGSGKNHGECCQPIISGSARASDAEALMRSRYTAHVVGDTDYLDRTYLPTARGTDSVGHELGKRKWVKLEIHQHDAQVKPGLSHVDFSAHYTEEGVAGAMHEKSEFEEVDDAWVFTRTLRQGPQPIVNAPKVGRNEPCPCGSRKKFKKCCG